MHVVIVGCGRSGSALAARLGAEGDTVAVIDTDRRAADRLPPGFGGRFVAGDGIRRDVLERAGVARADALVALSADDAVNIVAARVARDTFRVPRVVGRLHSTDRAPACAELGLPMVTTVRMTVDRVHRLLRHQRLQPEQTFGNGETVLVRSAVPAYLAGRRVADLNVAGEIQVVEVTRAGHSSIPGSGASLHEGDMVTFVVASASLARLQGFLGGRLG